MANKLSFEKEFLKAQPKRTQILRYMREAIGVKEVVWDQLTTLNLSKVSDYINEAVSPNSASVYLAILKAFLGKYIDDGFIPCKKPHKVLKGGKCPQQNVALTESEVAKIEGYYDRLWETGGDQIEKDCLTLFLLEVFCGARGCDIENMTLKNLDGNKVSYVSKKTHVLTIEPEHRRLKELIIRKPLRDYCPMTKNRVLKRVAKKCGITQQIQLFYRGVMQSKPKYEYIGSHTARRTFASILAARGVPIAEISQFMGHTNTSMTERYIKVDTQQVSAEAMGFFA